MLFESMHNMFSEPCIISMTDLCLQLIEHMKSLGVDDLKEHTKKHIRRKIEAEFSDSVDIISDDNRRLVVVPCSLSKETLVKENIKMAQLLKNQTSQISSDSLSKCALKIRNDVKESKWEQDWSPQPDMLNDDYTKIPKSLQDFVSSLICGNENPTSTRVKRLVSSISQNCVYAISGGKKKPAKHVLLPWAVKSLTGNVELIKILNRLGHGISYSQLEEIDTALCLSKLTDDDGSCVPLPSKILPCIPSHLAYDNIDPLEETLSGSGTSHRVNGIIIQPTVPTVQQEIKPINVEKLKKRSIIPTQPTLVTYNAGIKVGPPVINAVVDFDFSDASRNAQMMNRFWCLARHTNMENQHVPSWTGFNILSRNQNVVSEDRIGYLPTINAPATEMTTVNEILQECLKIMEKLQVDEIPCCFDQALYAKASEIVWKSPDQFKPIVLTMGTFHTICNLMGTIGKRFQGSGLRDLAVETGVIAEGSVDATLDGRHYNRALRLHKLMYEALWRLAWKGFLPWLRDHHMNDFPHLEQTLTKLDSITIDQKNIESLCNESSVKIILAHFDGYLNTLRSANGNLSAYWMSYLDIVEVLLGLVRASREGNWNLHLAMIREIIPWCFAYDKLNYARYLPVYLRDMSRLEIDHPSIFLHFKAGGFSTQLGDVNTFGCIAIDQAIEETVNRDTQTSGGTKGFSLNPGAISRYYINAEYRSTCLRQLRKMIHVQSTKLSHPDLKPSRIARDESDINSLTDIMEQNWKNPFEGPSGIISLSTGQAVPENVTHDLMKAREIGEKAYNDFLVNRMSSDSPQKFYDRLQKQNLKTFKQLQKTKRTKATSKEVVLKADHKLFGHMVLVAGSRNLDMKQVLQHPLGPLPWALSNCDGTLKKTSKATLARHLEKRAAPADEIPKPTACIIDGMCLVHKVSADHKTFAELADHVFMAVHAAGTECDRIDVVFDTIKDAERVARGSLGGVLCKNIIPGQKIQQWKKILACSESKTTVINFLAEEWKSPRFVERIGPKEIYISTEASCFKISGEGCTTIDDLTTTQEEADTKLLLHAMHASYGYAAQVIICDDTDVFILCLAFHQEIKNVYIKCGTQTRCRYINVSQVSYSLGSDLCEALLGLLAYTGCDSVSAFSGRGKLAGFKLIDVNQNMRRTMSDLGRSWELSSDLFHALQEFTCRLYSPNSTVTQVNELRYQLFRTKKGAVESGQRPPCKDTLFLHAQRANYQAAIWRCSLQKTPNIPSPTAHGWILDGDKLSIEWMKGPPAPEVVLEFLSCKCRKECKAPSCQCVVNAMKCTPACKLQDCTNMSEDTNFYNEDSDSDLD